MDFGVRILAVSPGPVDTGRLETMLKKRAALPEWGGQESGWQVSESYISFDTTYCGDFIVSLRICLAIIPPRHVASTSARFFSCSHRFLTCSGQGLLQRFPGGRAASSREVADVIVFLCSDKAGLVWSAHCVHIVVPSCVTLIISPCDFRI
jgi:NAD(P)-dependent dehydrogenase (short-subunit alcohol dehydrogenase family)